jgi:hypothetical protein
MKLMSKSLQAHTESDKQFQIVSDLSLMTLSHQDHYKTHSKLKLFDLKFALWSFHPTLYEGLPDTTLNQLSKCIFNVV